MYFFYLRKRNPDVSARAMDQLGSTELGCIACEELGDLGAGKEGWLIHTPGILCALDTRLFALSNGVLILIFSLVSNNPPFKISPSFPRNIDESITALEWIVCNGVRFLAVGTSLGYLMFFSIGGDLVFQQIVYSLRILKFRAQGTKSNEVDDFPKELCAVMPGVIARFDGSDIQNMLHPFSEEIKDHSFDQKLRKRVVEGSTNSIERLPYQIWDIGKYGPCVDAAITGIMPPSLLEFEPSQSYYCAVGIGKDAVISSFRLSESRSRSFVGVVMSKIVPVTFSTLSSFSKIIWRSEQADKKVEEKPESFTKASPLTCIKDHPRKGENLTVSPRGTLAAITDSLGRVLLLDTRALLVVRIWKGYRDASCMFLELKSTREVASTSAYEHTGNDRCLCLAIHAPRKGIIEVWEMRTGPRLRTVDCPKGTKMVQSSSTFPPKVFLLNGDSGLLSRLD